MGEGTVAKAGGGFGGLMLVGRHVAVDSSTTVGLFIVVTGGVARMLSVGVDRHGEIGRCVSENERICSKDGENVARTCYDLDVL